ncbi:response regulator transcription factor [Hungatella sp. L12]|uniref:Stage 0 sporulation protein A homolog n=1 Tax=Hungatella hominis TaxID=2763050 RepID=A0ABR7H813_9FIRM|nr:response regulator transcription factor [Hungatella hominis]MBC5709330.1 response regulator transcription factor [Hungatella hominis]
MSRILIVEDDTEIVKNLIILLREEGFVSFSASGRKAALEAIERENFDLVLLDVALPDGNGYSLCNVIKRKGDIPVIFLTAMGDEASIVTGFDLGADDYVSKPFKPLELVSRIKNALRRYGKSPAIFQISDLRVDSVKASVSKSGKDILLSALEYRLLLVFLNHPGQVLSRGRLLEELWDIAGDYVNDNTLTVNIKRLRDKIETDASNPAIIKTVRGLGYRLGG